MRKKNLPVLFKIIPFMLLRIRIRSKVARIRHTGLHCPDLNNIYLDPQHKSCRCCESGTFFGYRILPFPSFLCLNTNFL